METYLQDLRYSIRLMLRNKAITAIVVITLMIGIGANTAIFSIVNGVLLRPLPYQKPEQVVRIFDCWKKNHQSGSNEADVAPANFLDWRGQAKSFTDIAAFVTGGAGLVSGDEPQQISAAEVTASFFTILALKPIHGRLLVEDDMKLNNIVLGHDLWKTRFGGNPDIVGQRVKLDGELYTVVGILPSGFDYPEKAEVWTPLDS